MRVSAITTFWNNPYLAVYWKRLYDQYWKDEIDELLVCVHGEDYKVNHFIAGLFPNSRITAIPLPEMGSALDYIYPFVTGDVLVTVDSDNFITQKGVIKKYALMIGEYDVIGTAGKSTRPLEIGEEIAKKFGLVRINTFLSFWDKREMDKTPFTFQRMRFDKDEEFMGYKFPDQCKIDTMGYLTLKFMQDHKYLIVDRFEGSQHIGGLSHYAIGDNRKLIMTKIINETINEVPEELR